MDISHIIKKIEKTVYSIMPDDFKVELINFYQIKIDMYTENIKQLRQHNGNQDMQMFQPSIEQYQHRIKRLKMKEEKVYHYIKDSEIKQGLLEYKL